MPVKMIREVSPKIHLTFLKKLYHKSERHSRRAERAVKRRLWLKRIQRIRQRNKKARLFLQNGGLPYLQNAGRHYIHNVGGIYHQKVGQYYPHKVERPYHYKV